MDEETPSIPRYLGEGWRGSPRPSHNNEKQSMVFVKSSANDKSSPRLEDLSFADDLTNPIDCFSLLWDGRGDPLHPSPRERGGWATGSRRDRRRPQETSAPVTRFEKKLPTAPLIAPKDKPQRASGGDMRPHGGRNPGQSPKKTYNRGMVNDSMLLTTGAGRTTRGTAGSDIWCCTWPSGHGRDATSDSLCLKASEGSRCARSKTATVPCELSRCTASTCS